MPRLTSKIIVQGSTLGGSSGGVTAPSGAATGFNLLLRIPTGIPSVQFPTVAVIAYRSGSTLPGTGLTVGTWLSGSIINYTHNGKLFSIVLEEDGEFVGSPVTLDLTNTLTSPTWDNIIQDYIEEASLTVPVNTTFAVRYDRVKIPAPNREVWAHKIDEQYTDESNINAPLVASSTISHGRSSWLVRIGSRIEVFDRIVDGINVWKVIGVADGEYDGYTTVTATRKIVER